MVYSRCFLYLLSYILNCCNVQSIPHQTTHFSLKIAPRGTEQNTLMCSMMCRREYLLTNLVYDLCDETWYL